jgi:hypothetical protein
MDENGRVQVLLDMMGGTVCVNIVRFRLVALSFGGHGGGLGASAKSGWGHFTRSAVVILNRDSCQHSPKSGRCCRKVSAFVPKR